MPKEGSTTEGYGKGLTLERGARSLLRQIMVDTVYLLFFCFDIGFSWLAPLFSDEQNDCCVLETREVVQSVLTFRGVPCSTFFLCLSSLPPVAENIGSPSFLHEFNLKDAHVTRLIKSYGPSYVFLYWGSKVVTATRQCFCQVCSAPNLVAILSSGWVQYCNCFLRTRTVFETSEDFLKNRFHKNRYFDIPFGARRINQPIIIIVCYYPIRYALLIQKNARMKQSQTF